MTFTEYFGPSARGRILDFLGDHPTMDYSITELAAKSGVSRPSIYVELEHLLRLRMVKQTRALGTSRLFALNLEHPVVREILVADMASAMEHASEKPRQIRTRSA